MPRISSIKKSPVVTENKLEVPAHRPPGIVSQQPSLLSALPADHIKIVTAAMEVGLDARKIARQTGLVHMDVVIALGDVELIRALRVMQKRHSATPTIVQDQMHAMLMADRGVKPMEKIAAAKVLMQSWGMGDGKTEIHIHIPEHIDNMNIDELSLSLKDFAPNLINDKAVDMMRKRDEWFKPDQPIEARALFKGRENSQEEPVATDELVVDDEGY